jgi:hypothetical protein
LFVYARRALRRLTGEQRRAVEQILDAAKSVANVRGCGFAWKYFRRMIAGATAESISKQLLEQSPNLCEIEEFASLHHAYR